jgi:serine/threonine protein kinase
MVESQQTTIKIGSHYLLYLNKKLGNGAFGEIYLGLNQKNYQEVAIKLEKKINKPQLHHETRILKELQRGTGIPKIYYFHQLPNFSCLIQELLGPSLENLFNLCNRKFSLKTTLILGIQMINRIEFIHNHGIIHRDIKPDNLMMNSYGYIKVIDFGVAKYLMKDYTNTIIGTPHYMSPEVILGKHYSFEVDYWSTGIVLYEVFYGKVPFGCFSNDINQIYKEIIECSLHLPSDPKNESFNNLCNLLLNKNPSVRISKFVNVKNHSFFKNFDFESLLNFTFKSPIVVNSIFGNNEEELIKNDKIPFLNFMRNNIYQSLSDIDENFIKKSLCDDILTGF